VKSRFTELQLKYSFDKTKFEDWRVSERMMRCGVEAGHYEARTPQDIKQIAILTLKQDKYEKT